MPASDWVQCQVLGGSAAVMCIPSAWLNHREKSLFSKNGIELADESRMRVLTTHLQCSHQHCKTLISVRTAGKKASNALKLNQYMFCGINIFGFLFGAEEWARQNLVDNGDSNILIPQRIRLRFYLLVYIPEHFRGLVKQGTRDRKEEVSKSHMSNNTPFRPQILDNQYYFLECFAHTQLSSVRPASHSRVFRSLQDEVLPSGIASLEVEEGSFKSFCTPFEGRQVNHLSVQEVTNNLVDLSHRHRAGLRRIPASAVLPPRNEENGDGILKETVTTDKCLQSWLAYLKVTGFNLGIRTPLRSPPDTGTSEYYSLSTSHTLFVPEAHRVIVLLTKLRPVNHQQRSYMTSFSFLTAKQINGGGLHAVDYTLVTERPSTVFYATTTLPAQLQRWSGRKCEMKWNIIHFNGLALYKGSACYDGTSIPRDINVLVVVQLFKLRGRHRLLF
ncbi:hypothetical protein BKA83DRAFT_4132460 [Pisolithus microcarpus]|nr:hypothetical protein BKA83DRAFT_4132460 [Pisolithus microcarpus]